MIIVGYIIHAGAGPGESCSVNGRIRLAGGTTGFDGRLEICKDHIWSTVCYRGQYSNNNLATVICRELGLSGSITGKLYQAIG